MEGVLVGRGIIPPGEGQTEDEVLKVARDDITPDLQGVPQVQVQGLGIGVDTI